MSYPWTVPVPVEASTFAALREEHRELNIEVSLGRIGSYSSRRQPEPSDHLLHCDFQLNLAHNHAGRLGAGRAGFYRGHYLKGVGRTSLAGNWNTDDLYHCSGVLMTSAAIREYLVSGLVAAHGRPELVNRCTGVLVRALPDELRDHACAVFSHDGKPTPLSPSPADLTMQAISVKSGAFARMSNFVWWLNQIPFFRREGDDRMAELFEALDAALTGFETEGADGVGPDRVARRLAERFTLVLARLQAAWSIGIDWGSVHNNYALDGRFLDLEMPTVFPSAVLGIKVETQHARGEQATVRQPGELLGFVAPLRCATEMRLFAAWVKSRLAFMLANLPMYGLEREYVGCFIAELDDALREPHPLSAPEHLARAVIDPIAAALDLTSASRRELERTFAFAAAPVFPEAPAPSGAAAELRVRRLDLHELAKTEPDTRWTIYVPDAVREACSREHHLNVEFNRRVTHADQLEEPHTLLAYLAHEGPAPRDPQADHSQRNSARNE